jgi:hypothetical protein
VTNFFIWPPTRVPLEAWPRNTLSVLAKHANESIAQKSTHSERTDSIVSYERLGSEFEENGNGPWAQIGWNSGIPAELNVFGSRVDPINKNKKTVNYMAMIDTENFTHTLKGTETKHRHNTHTQEGD